MSLFLSCPLPFTVTKLQVSKSKRTLTLVENRPIQLNCSVKSQTSPNSHFAVLWYVHKPSDADGKLILKTTHNSAFEYGTYAEEEGLRGRLQFERHVSGGLFSLTVQRAEVSDSGSYYCHVEEWLLSPNYAWYKLAEEVSGRTEVTVKQPGKNRRCGHHCPVGFLQTLGLGELCSLTHAEFENRHHSLQFTLRSRIPSAHTVIFSDNHFFCIEQEVHGEGLPVAITMTGVLTAC